MEDSIDTGQTTTRAGMSAGAGAGGQLATRSVVVYQHTPCDTTFEPGVLQAKKPVKLMPEFSSLCPMIDLGTTGYGAVPPGGVRAEGGWASSGYSIRQQ